ncbi:PAS domain-containing sensor histidine kinase [Paenibacillus filicis]|uniref:histidine kinase n=2 Tax=Paenibacillus gyeongsangnamensis TaxID=3388067 RepID=A0ABT4QEL7_9BACL|nr:PAS domain-containing sensor histidine kinase [Paenibacillus filicis]MCZ8515263.1 PAS domain-containing sensor histidine kinase [Paenibacillus filicis]
MLQLEEHIPDQDFRSELKLSLQQLAELKIALDESSIVAVTDRRGLIRYVNDKFCEISKYEHDELLGRDHRIINSGYHSKEFMQNLWQTISMGRIWRGEIKNRAKDGSYYWVNTTIVPLIGEDEKPYQYLAVRNEVTQLKQAEEELQQLMTKMMHIQEEERRRFSRELHDGIGQSLFSLIIQLDRVMQEIPNDEIRQIRENVTGIIEDVRGLAWELRPSVLDDLGVVPAIRTYLESYSSHYGIHIRFDNTLRKRLGLQEETAIYRVIQEALTNVAKYANVTEATVTLHETVYGIEARIEDHGRGFVRNKLAQGVGLFSMEERARAVGGSLEVVSTPDSGTTVRLILPKKE